MKIPTESEQTFLVMLFREAVAARIRQWHCERQIEHFLGAEFEYDIADIAAGNDPEDLDWECMELLLNQES